MKSTDRFAIYTLTLLTLMVGLHAQESNPREQFQSAVAAYQKSPTRETALKVIELSKQLDPPPAVPEEAREPFVMGVTVLKKAGDPTGAAKAADLFTQSLNIAPWFSEAYYNRALARETAGQFTGAMDDLKFYLEFKLPDNERREVQDKIYSLKADAQLAAAKKLDEQKAAAAKAAAESPEGRQDALLQKVEGARFIDRPNVGPLGSYDVIFVIKNRMLQIAVKIYANNTSGTFFGKNRPGEHKYPPIPYSDGAFRHTSDQRRLIAIRSDGQALLVSYPDSPELGQRVVNLEK